MPRPAKTKILSEDDARKILERNVGNVVKKAASGKPLTPRELKLIEQFAAPETVTEASAPEWVRSYDELARTIGCHHHSFPRWRKNFKDAPKPRHNGEHNVAAWRAFFILHPEIQLETTAAPGRGELEIVRLKEQCRRIKFENDTSEGAFIALEPAREALRTLTELLKATLRTSLEDELPPILQGLPAAAIRVHMKELNDRLCGLFQDGARGIAPPPGGAPPPGRALGSTA